jgi:hypothetical protein
MSANTYAAKGGALLEIFYGVSSGSMSQTYTDMPDSANDGEYKYDLSGGQQFGLKLGFLKYGFVIGTALYGGSFNYTQTHPNGTQLLESEFDVQLTTGFIMYRGFSKFVPYLGMILDGSFEDSKEQYELSDSGGLVMGLGYKLSKFLNITVEYKSYSFKKQSDSTGTEVTYPTDNQSEFDVSEYLIFASIPIEFGAKGGR